MISIIAAMDRNGLIGKEGELPWHILEDMRYFKNRTMGKSVIMGKKTYFSLKGDLPGRDLIVLSLEEDPSLKEVKTAHSIKEALSLAKGEVMVAGGASIYGQFLDLADRMYLTVIDKEFEGDTYFPEFDMREWVVKEEQRGENTEVTYKILERSFN